MDTTYNIEKVKYYFLYHFFRSHIPNLKRKWFIKESFIVSNIAIFLSISLALGSIILWFMGPAYIVYCILFWIIWISLTPFFYNEMRKSWWYMQLEKYFTIKSHLEESLNQLKKKINEDITQEWVSIINLDEIHKIINTLSDILSLITWPLISFRKTEKTLQKEQKLVLEKFVTLEQIWISEYIDTFKNLLKKWMETHTNELKSEILTIEKSRIDSLVKLYIASQAQEAQNIKIIL